MRAVNTLIVDRPGTDYVASPSGTAHSVQITYANKTGQTLYVFMGYIWVGVSKDNFGDVSFELWNQNKSIIYRDSNDDHYENRTGIPMNEAWIPPMGEDRAFVVDPDDVLILGLTANADANTPLVAQSYARLYYTLE